MYLLYAPEKSFLVKRALPSLLSRSASVAMLIDDGGWDEERGAWLPAEVPTASVDPATQVRTTRWPFSTNLGFGLP